MEYVSNQNILSFSNEHNQDAFVNWKVNIILPVADDAIQDRVKDLGMFN